MDEGFFKQELVGIAGQSKPPNRFEKIVLEDDFADFDSADQEHHAEIIAQRRRVKPDYYKDDSKSIVSENNSPDIGFRYSLNAYRGCEHGCSYCYARPSHEFWGLNAGIDFETKIFVKPNAPKLFRKWLEREKWQPEPICFSGNTDCYQPIEKKLELTRKCLEIAAEFRQPIKLITKNALVCRDLEILKIMAAQNLVHVAISMTSLDQSLTRVMEPKTSSPAARLNAISQFAEAKIPVHAMLSPIIPGLNDSEIPELLKQVSNAGAKSSSYIILRLPLSVAPVFTEWLERKYPSKSKKILEQLRSTRDGKLNESQFGLRMRGTGEIAEQIKQLFRVFAAKYNLDRSPSKLDNSKFHVAKTSDGQLKLF